MFKLYPMPVEITEKEGKYEFLYVSASGIENEVILNTYKEMGITLQNGKEANVIYTKKDGLSDEEYEIIINENGAEIVYTCESGAFYATQTLCQLINKKAVSYLHIKDKPLNHERLISLDISRGKLFTMDYFKRIIDYLAMARYNTLFLYYDRLIIQFPSFKECWEEDAITIEELKQIKKWCNEKFIKLTIGTETFGHLENFLKYDCFKHLSNSLDESRPGGDINPYHPEAMNLIDNIVGDIVPFIDTDYIYIGGDEVMSLKNGKTKDMVAQKGLIPVYMEHINKVCELVKNKYNKIPLVAEDMFLKRNMTEAEMEENLKIFPKNAMIFVWGYESEYEYYPFDKTNKIIKKFGIPFINLASTGTFIQYIPRTYNQSLNAEVTCRQAYENGGVGAGTSCFYDCGGSNMFVVDLGGIFLFGSTAWNHKGFQLSYVHEYMNKYVYMAENCDFAGLVAGLGDSSWYTKGKTPDTNVFAFVMSACPYNDTIMWKGYHAHTGISSIHISDMVDEYGCKKALTRIKAEKKEIENAVIKCEYADEYKRKILFDFNLFETAVLVSYFKLSILVTKDLETAKSLVFDIEEHFEKAISEFPKLWVSESRKARVEIFLNTLIFRRDAFRKAVEENL